MKNIYNYEFASDVKYEYIESLREGYTNEEAYNRILTSFASALEDSDDAPVIWIALADTMWDVGRLTEEVRSKVKSFMKNEKDYIHTEDAERECKLQQVLAKYIKKIDGPMPEEKLIRKKRVFKNKWQVGDMYVLPIEGKYPRFPEMKIKYLLLIKIGDYKDLSDHIQPLAYIKYLEEEYHEGMDLNQLLYAKSYNEGYRFVPLKIAGKKLPSQLTYVGNYGDVSLLEKPDGLDNEMPSITCNDMWHIEALEEHCIKRYLLNVLNVEKNKVIGGEVLNMTEEEYEAYREKVEREKVEQERKLQDTIKKKRFYVCPWENGDLFYLPIEEEHINGKDLIDAGYVGIVFFLVGKTDERTSINQWPILVMQCVKKQYGSDEEVIRDKVFDTNIIYKKHILTFSPKTKLPEKIRKIGRFDGYESIKTERNAPYPKQWEIIEKSLYRLLEE